MALAVALTVAAYAAQPPAEPGGDAPQPAPGERLSKRKSLEESVAEAQAIVVATALDFAPAPPKVKGDAPENTIRFRVQRVLKGEMKQEFITTRTPTSGAEFVGRDWVVMLSPEWIAGNHQYAGCYTIKVEPEVKAAVAKAAK